MARPSLFQPRSFVTVLLTVALVFVGFGHKSVQPEMTPELAAYVAAGGDIWDLCGIGSGEREANGAECEACRIADTLVQLGRSCLIAPERLERTETFRFIAKRLAQSQGLDPARLTRAPPQA